MTAVRRTGDRRFRDAARRVGADVAPPSARRETSPLVPGRDHAPYRLHVQLAASMMLSRLARLATAHRARLRIRRAIRVSLLRRSEASDRRGGARGPGARVVLACAKPVIPFGL